ncbi:MAG: hypothetical protein A4S09_08270 [Proteobacteria bacterium SG_bin7]|nr:MAG: hypothetical protein A4S09_08270 [Proteobacteria bacterium SG_bin7]
MTIISVLLLLFNTSFAVENVARFCRFKSELVVYDQYLVQTPKGNCEIVSFDVLSARECNGFVKEKVGQCYQLGKIYDRSEPKQKKYTACFSCSGRRQR